MKTALTIIKRFLHKNQFYLALLFWVGLMFLHLRGYYLIPPEGVFPTEFLVLAVTSLIGIFIQSYQKKKIESITWYTFILGLSVSMNYVLFRMGFSLFNYIVVFITLGLIFFWNRVSLKTAASLRQAAVVLLLLAAFLAVDYNHYQERLIKDHQLDQFIREEHHFSHPVSREELSRVNRFYLSRRNQVSRLDGLEHFTNLEQIGFYDAYMINDLSPLTKLPKLERLAISGGDLSELNHLEEMESVKKLELTYPNRGNLKTLAAFPNLNNLYIQGIDSPEDFDSLMELEISSSLQELSLGVMKEVSFKELAHFENLEVLRFFRVKLEDIEYIKELDHLERISIQYVSMEDEARFVELLQEHGIILDDRG